MIKYKAKSSYIEIEKVEVEKETDNSVFINGRRYAKLTNSDAFFNTFEEAKNWIIKMWEDEVNSAKSVLEYRKAKLGNAKGLKEN